MNNICRTIFLSLAVLGCLMPSGSFAQDAVDLESHTKLLQWMRTNVSEVTRMPLSFEIWGDKAAGYKKLGRRSSLTGIIERIIVDQGVSIYDAALWQMALASTGNKFDIELAEVPVAHYWKGMLGETDIRTGYGRQIFVYDPANPEEVTSELFAEGERGFIFRILNANGVYISPDPWDGKTIFADFPNYPTIHWEDWKPIAGENAWVVMASLRIFFSDPLRLAGKSVEFQLAEELARAALYLQAENGGIRMAPIGTYYHMENLELGLSDNEVAERLDTRAKAVSAKTTERPAEIKKRVGRSEYAPYHLWYYDEISVENNISWYAAFRMLHQLTGDAKYMEAMERIEAYAISMWDPKDSVFYQGAHFVGDKWVPNTEPFATDVQNWAIIVFGPDKIDGWFGDGASYKMWQKTKSASGVYADGVLQGVGFTTEHDRLSVEWTAGAILAVRIMKQYYRLSHADWAAQLKQDEKTMRAGIDKCRYTVRPSEDAYSYSSVRRWIPFGWFSHGPEIMSLASTAWVYLIDRNINPFEF